MKQIGNFLAAILVTALPFLFVAHANAQVNETSGVNYDTQTIQIALGSEPPQLDYTRSTDAVSFFILEHIQEGLLRKDEHNRLAAGIANSWEMDDKTVKFTLRDDARWNDGQPITAHDFVYSWRRVVNPETASEYASIMYPIKNAERINNGNAPLESLGIKALDDHTLLVELESPTGYFFELMPFGLFYPARQDFVEAQNGRFGADVQNMLFSGPFMLTRWVHGASLRLEKNPQYWNSDIVHLNAINIAYITPDGAARFNLFKDGKLALEGGVKGMSVEQLKDALDNRYRIRGKSDGSVFYMEFNHRPERITANLNFRKALQYVIDTQELVNKVIGIAGYVPGKSLFPEYLVGVTDRFREEYPVPIIPLNLEKAHEHLELDRQELELEEFPPLILLVDDGSTSLVQAQYFQAHLKQTLGLELKIDIQTFKQRLAKMLEGQFDIVLAGWGPDYNDPFTFAELFASWNANNRGRYASDEYDRLVRLVQGTADQQARMDAMGRMQSIIVEDVVVIPTYERKIAYVQDPALSGVLFKVTGGSPIYTYARIIDE